MLTTESTTPINSLTTEGTIPINSDRLEDEYDMEDEDSIDLTDEEDKGLSDTQMKMMQERAAIRVMRSMTKSLAKGDEIDTHVTEVLEKFCKSSLTIRSFNKEMQNSPHT